MNACFQYKYAWLYVQMITFVLVGCSNLLFFPVKKHYFDPKDRDVNYNDVYIENALGEKIHAWLLPETTGQHKATIVYFHGNGENISTHVGAVYWLPQYGYRVLIADYRGYGKSDGVATLDGSIDDILLTIDYAANELTHDRPLIVMGQSIGASMSIYATSRSVHKRRITALVLVAPFSEYRKIVREVLASNWLTWVFQYPLSWTISSDYDPLKYIGEISPMPVLFFHGTDDVLISFEHSRTLFNAAKRPKQLIPLHGGHNDVMSRSENLQKILDSISKIVDK